MHLIFNPHPLGIWVNQVDFSIFIESVKELFNFCLKPEKEIIINRLVYRISRSLANARDEYKAFAISAES